MLNYFEEKKKKPFLTLKNRISQSPKKIAFSLKGVNPCFWPKNANFFLCLQLIKKRLEIMLGDFAEKKEIFFDLKKTEFFKLQKIPLFQRG